MIAKAKSVSHGINVLNYISGEAASKKHPELIYHIFDNMLAPGLDPWGKWMAMKMATARCQGLKNDLIRIELSPSAEHTRDFTPDDWRRLALEYLKEFDAVEIRDRDGRLVSGRTNLAGSMSTGFLHLDSKGGTPHMHIAVCRVDGHGHTNNDHQIHLRAQIAAERLAIRRGWTTAAQIRETAKERVSADCLDILRGMPEFSLGEYFARLRQSGYGVNVREDTRGIVRGYVLSRGHSRYKASELGTGRNLTAGQLARSWRKLRGQERDYTIPRPGRRRVEFSHGHQTFVRHIPERVIGYFEREFCGYSNAAELMSLASYYFSVAGALRSVMMAGSNPPPAETSANTAPANNRDSLEEEMWLAIKSARAALAQIRPIRRPSMKR